MGTPPISDEVKQIQAFSNFLGREDGHTVIGPEYLLAGLLQTFDGVLSRTLHYQGIDAQNIRTMIWVEVPPRLGAIVTPAMMQFTSGYKSVLTCMVQLARANKHQQVVPEHLEMGLLMEVSSPTLTTVLTKCHLDRRTCQGLYEEIKEPLDLKMHAAR